MVSTLGAVPGADTAIEWARTQLGKPYVFGAAGPNTYDCSGLVMRAWQHAGVYLTHSTYVMIHQGIGYVDKSELLPGDLIFPNPGHVQLYSGNGKVIEAPESGIPVREVPMWGFWKARRMRKADTTTSVTNGIGDPVSSVPSGAASFSGSGSTDYSALDWITTAHNWFRIGEVAAGAVLIVMAAQSIGGL